MRNNVLWVALLALVLAACAARVPPDEYAGEDVFESEDEPLVPVRFVDVERYMGRWYMIANIPYFAEAGNLAPYVIYQRRADGLINNDLYKKDSFDEEYEVKNGYIEITNPLNNAEGLVTFLRPIWQKYAIVYLDEDYRHSVIAHPSRSYCWVFSREPYVDDATYAEMLQTLADNGFNTKLVLKFPRTPVEVGLPGYQ